VPRLETVVVKRCQPRLLAAGTEAGLCGDPGARRRAEIRIRLCEDVAQSVGHKKDLFRVIKRQFGYVKTRYRGLTKNRAQLFTLFALGNLFLDRRRLLA